MLGLLALSAVASLSPGPSVAASEKSVAATDDCTGELSASEVAPAPGPRLRFGLTPAGEAGALGPEVPAVPDRPRKTLAALARLRAGEAPLVLRLNRFFWSEGRAGVRHFLRLTRRYTRHGYLVELQLRYHPRPAQEGKIAAWTRFVRRVVRRFGRLRRVVALQVTNEVNFTISPDSSDGAYQGARDALVRGVIAAKDEARKRPATRHLSVGFNWFYRTDPDTDRSFWEHLRDGGRPFRRAVDWVGLDAYPGTVFPPLEPPGGERDGMVNALSVLRRCYMPIARLGRRIPIHVEENGWPTGPGRSYDDQATVLESMVRAVHDFRGTFNVSDYRWFDLRDHDTSSTNFQHHYGLLESDYSRKPAFAAYRRLIRKLG